MQWKWPAGHAYPPLRKAVFSLAAAVTSCLPAVMSPPPPAGPGDWPKPALLPVLAPIVLGGFGEKESSVHPAMLDAAVTLMKAFR